MTNIRQVISLVVDLIGSTKQGLKMPEPRLRRFNREVVFQIWPYLKELDIEDSQVKFTGDGWLIFNTDMNKLRAMVALAKILSARFQSDIANQMQVPTSEIPDIRLAMAAAYDDQIELPNGIIEWVGDSARMATRSSGCCAENQLIVTGAIRERIRRDFEFIEIEVKNLPKGRKPKNWEENFQIFSVEELRSNFISDLRFAEDPSEFAPYAIYLRHVGRHQDAMKLIGEAGIALTQQIKESANLPTETPTTATKRDRIDIVISRFTPLLFAATTREMRDDLIRFMFELNAPPGIFLFNRLIHKSTTFVNALDWFTRMIKMGVLPDVVTYNTLINLSPDLPTAESWFAKMTEAGVPPNVITYSTLINLSPDLPTAKSWFTKMTEAGVPPNVITYSTLINLSPDLPTAESWFTKMTEAGVPPNVITYNTLINLSPDLPTAESWFTKMTEAGVPSNVITYSTLINLSPDLPTAESWFTKMTEAGVPPNVITYNTLINLSPDLPTAESWFTKMTEAGVPPNVITYSTLINLSPDLPTAESWFTKMTEADVPPNVITYNTLINLSPDLPTAESWFTKMTEAGVPQSEITASTLASKIQTVSDAERITAMLQKVGAFIGQGYYSAIYARIARYYSATELLNWHFRQKYNFIPALESAIKAYATLGRMEDSFRIALAFPYLAAARKVFRQNGDAAVTYYTRLLTEAFEPQNVTYALGVCYMENNRDSEALQILKEALQFATAEKRKEDIRQRIVTIEARSITLK